MSHRKSRNAERKAERGKPVEIDTAALYYVTKTMFCPHEDIHQAGQDQENLIEFFAQQAIRTARERNQVEGLIGKDITDIDDFADSASGPFHIHYEMDVKTRKEALLVACLDCCQVESYRTNCQRMGNMSSSLIEFVELQREMKEFLKPLDAEQRKQFAEIMEHVEQHADEEDD